MAVSTEELQILLSLEDQVSGEIDGVKKKFQDVGKSITGVGKAATIGLTAPLVAAGTLAVMAASDLDESMNKVAVVFGDAAAEVVAFSEDAATALGITQQQALESAGTFGNLFTAMGIGQDQASGMSTELLTLAADLASFNNIDPTIALEKLRAGLVGEVEPLRTLGVNLSAAATEAKALELGLIAEGEEMTAAAKAQANFALIMEQTTNAQGDFARTSDGLANSMRIVKAQIFDVAAQIGMVLLPFVQQAAQFIRTLMERFQGVSPEMQRVIVIVGVIVAAIGPLLLIIGSLVSALGTIIPIVGAVIGVLSGPLLLIIGAVVAVIALLALAWKNNWGDIQGKTKAAIAFIKNLISQGLAAIKAFWDQHGERIIAIAKATWEMIQKGIDAVMSIIRSIQEAFQAAFAGDWEKFGEKLREAWDKAWALIIKVIKTAWPVIKKAVILIVTNVVKFFKETDWKQVGINVIKGIANGITNGVKWIISAAKRAAKAAYDAVMGFFRAKSPSELMFEVGGNFSKGLALGIEDASWIPATAARGMASQTASAATAGFSNVRNDNRNIQSNVYINNSAALALYLRQQEQLLQDQISGVL